MENEVDYYKQSHKFYIITKISIQVTNKDLKVWPSILSNAIY